MSRLWKKQLANERGATLALVAVCLAALMGAAALAIDLGMLYDARNEAQRAADAAALAGASVFVPPGLPLDREVTAAHDRAIEYGTLNLIGGVNVRPEELAVEVLPDEGKVRVTVTRDAIPLWFANIFGISTSRVRARAAAAVAFSGSVSCLRPIGFADLWDERSGEDERYSGFDINGPRCPWGDRSCDYYNPIETGRGMWWRNAGMPRPDGKGVYEEPTKREDIGRQITFTLNRDDFVANSPERLHRLQFYPLKIPGCAGGDCWRQGLAGSCSGTMAIDDLIWTEPGVQVGPTDQGLKAARDADPNARWNDATDRIDGSKYPIGCSGGACTGEGSPRVFNVAMLDPASRVLSNSSVNFPIQNFGAFFLEDWKASGNDTWIQVRWMHPKPVRDNCAVRGNCRSNLVLPLRLVE
jgi:hypothetical protein